MSDQVEPQQNFLAWILELSRPYDKLISVLIIVAWLFFRARVRVEDISTQLRQQKEEEKSYLEQYFPKQKPFHPDDIFVNEEDRLTRVIEDDKDEKELTNEDTPTENEAVLKQDPENKKDI